MHFNILTNIIYQKIKNYESPEKIVELFNEQCQPQRTSICLTNSCKAEKERYIKEDNEKKENLIKYIQYIQEKLVPHIKEENVLYFLMAYLFENQLIYIDENIFYFPDAKKGNYNKEAYEILKNNNQYTNLFFEILISFSNYKIIDLLIPNFSINPSFLSIISTKTLRKSLKVIAKNHRMRKINLLTDMLKIILTNGYNKDLIEVIIESYHDLAINCFFRSDYFYEIHDIIEWSITCPTLFEKLISIDLSHKDIPYLERYEKECCRLSNEFERVLRHPTLSDESQKFYCREIERLSKIRRVISNIIQRIIFLQNIMEKNAALRIQNAWYNYIEKICHPNHPKMQQRFNSLNYLDKK